MQTRMTKTRRSAEQQRSNAPMPRRLCDDDYRHPTRNEQTISRTSEVVLYHNAAPSHREPDQTQLDYTTPQKHSPPQLVLYQSMYQASHIPSSNPWNMTPSPPAPIKAHSRAPRIPPNPKMGRYAAAVPFILSPGKPPQPLLSPSTASANNHPVTPPTLGQNPISPPCPIRKATVNSPPRSSVLPTCEMEVDDGNDKETHEESPSKLVVYREPLFSQPILYEHVGLPHLRIFKVKLPQRLIESLDSIIQGAEQHAQSLQHGWKTELYSLTKCDVACREIPGIQRFVQPVFNYICQAINVLYGTSRLMVDKNQPHVLKYSAAMGHTGVELHHDRCDVTANLCLSDRREYQGGGTMIVDLGRVVWLEKGEVLLHPGSLVHGGMDIYEGTRFLLVTFAHFR